MIRVYMPVFLLAAAFAQQPDASTSVSVGKVAIPVELSTTIRADKAQRGDPIAFRSLEAVLLSNGVVMPANTKLTGRVVGAAPRNGDKPSWVVLLAESAEWKQQRVHLHAFIAAQIDTSRPAGSKADTATDTASTANPRRQARQSARVAIDNGGEIASSGRMPQDAVGGAAPEPDHRVQALKDIRFVRDKNGIVYLFCMTANVKLSNGTLLVLQNEPESGSDNHTSASVQPFFSETRR